MGSFLNRLLWICQGSARLRNFVHRNDIWNDICKQCILFGQGMLHSLNCLFWNKHLAIVIWKEENIF
jgi:hypothetical protein